MQLMAANCQQRRKSFIVFTFSSSLFIASCTMKFSSSALFLLASSAATTAFVPSTVKNGFGIRQTKAVSQQSLSPLFSIAAPEAETTAAPEAESYE
jgi:hypothetical protein